MLRVYIQGCRYVVLRQVWQFVVKEVWRVFEGMECIEERITRSQLKIEVIWVTVAKVYAWTEDSSLGIKYEFFQKLQKTVGSLARVDLMVVIARVSCDTSI